MRLTGIAVLMFGLIAGPVFAGEKKIWECRTSNAGSKPILHLVEWDSGSYVKFANARLSAKYELEEESQGWYFNNDGSGYYRYGVILQPDGKAWFHDFRETDSDGLSAPLDYFLCSKIS